MTFEKFTQRKTKKQRVKGTKEVRREQRRNREQQDNFWEEESNA